jgi:hypothetical protein
MKHLKNSGRRAFLRLAGGTLLGLPLLELTHGKAWSQGTGNKRFLTVFEHGGTITDQSHDSLHDGTGEHIGANYWKPLTAGTAAGTPLELGPIHDMLEPWKSKVLLLQGVDNGAAMGQAQYGSGGHGISNVTALTAADANDPWGEPESLGPSIDHVIADRLAAIQPVKFKRIHLNISGHQYGSPYYAGSNQRVYGEDSPRVAFETIFEGVTADAEPDPAFMHRQMLRRSILDGVVQSYAEVRNVVSSADRHIIEAHLEHLHALEAELNAAPVKCEPPTGIDAEGDEDGNIVGPLHVQIIVAALRCGLTNVANLEIADILTPWTPVGAPMPSGYGIGHSLGHFARDVGPEGVDAALGETWKEEMLDNRRWRMSLFKQLVEALDDPNFLEGDSTLLDNSIIYWTSEFSEPSQHVSSNSLCLLAGSAGGYFKMGRHINYNIHAQSNPNTLDYQSNESTHNPYTSFLQALGESDDHFGNNQCAHQGPLPNLT